MKKPLIRVKNLRKIFSSDHGKVSALEDVDFEVEEGEFLTLLGPSGCGKTTTLRCIAGIENPDSGEIWIGDQPVFRNKSLVPPNKRSIGVVFQSYALWPHMTVFDNVAFPLRHAKSEQKPDAQEITRRVHEALEMVRLSGMEKRWASALSGGQQQRVAVARAIVRRPDVLLLDEPLSNLDAKLREQMRFELKRLSGELGFTAIYVTHDQLEALSLSDRVALMSRGRIVELAKPRDLYLRPRSVFSAEFIGNTNFVAGQVSDAGTGSAMGKVATAASTIRCAIPDGIQVGSSVRLSIRYESIQLSNTPFGDDENVIRGTIEVESFNGPVVEYQVRTELGSIRAFVSVMDPLLSERNLYVRLPPLHCHVLPVDEMLPMPRQMSA